MRAKERIPIIFKIFRNNPRLFYLFLGIPIANEELIKQHSGFLSIEFFNYWYEGYQLRLGQALFNFYSNELFNTSYYKEESDFLVNFGYVGVEDIKAWGRNFDENMNRLSQTEYILLKDLSLDHIINIKKFFKGRLKQLPKNYLNYFNKRIKQRI